jgi:hypothetical protein
LLGDKIGCQLFFVGPGRKLSIAHQTVDIFSFQARIHDRIGTGFGMKTQGRSVFNTALGRIADSDDRISIFYIH